MTCMSRVKAKVLPALDDAFAKSFDAENLEKLRAGVRRDLENELNYSRRTAARGTRSCRNCSSA